MCITRLLTFCLILGLLWPALAGADEQQQQRFVEALGKVESGQANAEDYAGLRDYVLYPYLQAADLRNALRRSPGDYTHRRVEAFLQAHGSTAYSRGLRLDWLRRLAEQDRWQSFLAFYPDKTSEEFECLAAQARIELKREDAAAAAENLYRAGHLRHKACVPVFDWLKQSGRLTPALAEARAQLAMEAGNVKLVRIMLGKLSGKVRERAEYWLWAYRNPRDSITRLASSGDTRMDREIFAQVFSRLATVDRDRAAALYDKAMARAPADEVLKRQLAAYIGFRYILNREPEALHWYRRSGTVALREIESDWRIRSAIYNRAWGNVLDWIEALEPEARQSPRWQYWRGRALLARGEKAAAEQSWSQISGKRDFYGFLAADRLGVEYGIEDRPVAMDDEAQARLKARGDVRRAHELWQSGLGDKARAEWAYLLEDLNTAEQLQAGVLADNWGWWSRAIISYGRAGYWDDLGRRFPAPYRSVISREAKRHGIDHAWAYGIMRSESMFVRDARSPVGALGLMQLMPGTGRQVARSEGVRWLGTATLLEPEYNIRLGTRYLADMLKRFDGHIALATAAYNAGPRNVDRWRPSEPLAADIWIEAVPFGATHNYLRHVLEFTATYEWRLTGKPTRLSQRLPPVRPD